MLNKADGLFQGLISAKQRDAEEDRILGIKQGQILLYFSQNYTPFPAPASFCCEQRIQSMKLQFICAFWGMFYLF